MKSLSVSSAGIRPDPYMTQWWMHKYNHSLLCCNIIALASNIYKQTSTPDTLMKSTLLMWLIDFLLYVSIAEDFSAERLKHISLNCFELFKWCLSLRAVSHCRHFIFWRRSLAGESIWLKYKWPPVYGCWLQFISRFPLPLAWANSNTTLFFCQFFYITMGIL